MALLACASASPIYPIINTGPASGPVHATFGDLVATRRGLRPISLEGFSEDINQDGFVDPIAPAAPIVPAPIVSSYVAAPVLPAVAPTLIKAVEPVKVELPKVEVKKVELPAPVALPALPALPTTAYALPTPFAHAPLVAAPRLAQHALLTPGIVHAAPGFPVLGAPVAAVAPAVVAEKPAEVVAAVEEA